MATKQQPRKRSNPSAASGAALETARHWHAGGAGCGALVMGLKREIGRIRPGEQLRVTALDAAAFIDIAAWCQMTGHELIVERHPTYVVERKDDPLDPET